jgi:hypothetical protein
LREWHNVWEQSAEKNIWTHHGESNGRIVETVRWRAS